MHAPESTLKPPVLYNFDVKLRCRKLTGQTCTRGLFCVSKSQNSLLHGKSLVYERWI